MFENAVVAVDGSELAKNAGLLAVQGGLADPGSVHLVHVLDLGSLEKFADWMLSAEDREKQLAARQARVLEPAQQLLAAHSVNAKALKILEGSPAEQIEEYAASVRSGLIVLGRRGMSELGRAFMGSESQRLTEIARQPLLIVPECISGDQDHHFEKIIAPTDFSPAAEWGVRVAALLAEELKVELVLVNGVGVLSIIPIGPLGVGLAPFIDYPAIAARRLERAETLLENKAAEFREAGLKVSVQVDQDEALRAITRAAEAPGAGLIVMSTRGRSGIEKLFMGSVTSAVVRDSKVPILVIPPTPGD